VFGWLAYATVNAPKTLHALKHSGVVIWLVPILGVISILWSIEPSLTFRASWQNSS